MARYGQVLLRQLTFQYCDRMGCSEGMRHYIQTLLPAFAQRHPHVKIAAVLQRNKFPLVKAEYDLLPHNAAHLRRSVQRQEEQQVQQQQQQPQLTQQQQLQQQIAKLTRGRTLSQRQNRQLAKQQQLQEQQQPQDNKQQRFNSNVVGVKSRSAEDIQEVVWWLTQSQCRPRTSRIPVRHIVSKNRSIQGAWTASTF